jgi:hypothetical protein
VIVARQRLGDRVAGQLDLEHGLTDGDHVAGCDDRALDAVVADERSVGAVEILADEAILADANHTVVARDVLVGELEVLVKTATDGEF